ncbi:MAG TPA: hypothetical protein P5234_13420 [Thermoanaerobaculaceae bacterium]|nr:hypothetical protein [Thermoanaerobaculaceae bacterium]HRS17233.1 hypothetical protein [Thermoanaerobaculaceae bacterium]
MSRGEKPPLPDRAPGERELAPPASTERDRFRWDDRHHQPHTDLSYVRKLWASCSDAAKFLSLVGCSLRHLGPTVAAYRRLLGHPPVQSPAAGTTFGVAISPRPESWERYREQLDALGVRSLLLRVPVWDAEPVLALRPELEELARAGHTLTFVLVQDRAAVLDPARWRAHVERTVETLGPVAHAFQVGQAPNRKKWGVWRPDEYVRLLEGVAGVRAARPGCRWLGPSIIDFEYHFTVQFLACQRPFDFDGIAALLYVDRRGSPENRQYHHFDLFRKILLLRAVVEASGHPLVPLYLTEFNWPLRGTGGHSPAGRDVQTDEARQAAYLVLYNLAASSTGCVAGTSWWQLVARGYGLLDEDGASWRPRPALAALRTLQERAVGCTVHRLPETFRRVRGYVLEGNGCQAVLHAPRPLRVGGRLPLADAAALDGSPIPSGQLVLDAEPRYLRLETATLGETLTALAWLEREPG